MKFAMVAFLSALVLSGCTSSGNNHATLSSVGSFVEMESKIASWNDPAIANTLIVMDDDDTLTMMDCPEQNDPDACQYIGGPAWYAWQSDILDEPDNPYRVAKSENDLLDISALLLSMNQMPYTDPNIPVVLQNLVDKGARLLVLTARGNSNLSATEAQFTKLKIQNTDFLSFIKDNALLGSRSDIASIAGPVIPADCPARIPVTYQQGVMYVSGQNKGLMLQCLMAITDAGNVRNIVFLDDTAANVQDVYDAFKNNSNLNVLALHYTKLEKHKEALSEKTGATASGNKYQIKAHTRWTGLKAVLEQQLLQPNLPDTN